jgi:hypothetical protein
MNGSRNLTLPFIGGVALLMIGSCGTLLGLVMMLDVGKPIGTGGTPLELSTALVLLFLGLVLAVPGGMLVRSIRKRQQREHQEALEQRILRAAAAQNYRITAAEVAMQADLSLEEAQGYLERLARKGEIGVEVGENGVLVYNLREG